MIKATRGRVIVESITEEAAGSNEMKTGSGIFVSNVNENNLKRGKVVNIGPRKAYENGTEKEINFDINDIVLFNDYSTDVYYFNDNKYFILNEDSIIAVETE